MTAFNWYVRDRQVTAVATEAAAGGIMTVYWGLNTETTSGFPWAAPAYPSLLILEIGFTLACSAVVNARRPRVQIIQPGSGASGAFDWKAIGTTTATQIRRYEFGSGTSRDNSTAGQSFLEPLPEGLILLPGTPTIANAELNVSVDNFSAGDSYSAFCVHGVLLFNDGGRRSGA